MKLWQKIFIGTLILVMAAVEGTALLLLRQSQNLLFEQEKERAASEHAYMLSALENTIALTRLKRQQILLDEAETEAVAAMVIREGAEGRTGASLYFGGSRVLSTETAAEEEEAAVVQALDSVDPCIQFQEKGDTGRLLVASVLMLEQRDYVLVTSTDASRLIVLRREQLRYARTLSLAFSVVCAVVLLVMVWWLMRPLQRVNRAMGRIARGDYRMRLPVRGGSEMAQLARSTNLMAASIQKNVESLERVAEDQKIFIANLAHEMKTPLTSILGFADILRIKKRVSEEERQDFAGVIVEETKRLRSLSGKLMELIAVGNTRADFRPVSLRELVNEAEVTLIPVLAARQVGLRCEAEDAIIDVDRELFKSLLYNLADNAAKASQPGQAVEIRTERRDGKLVLLVIDEGAGIPAAELSRVTQPFYMVDKARSRKAGGAGLGLALCAEIARLHGITLAIESQVGKGTRIMLTWEKEGTEHEKPKD